MAWYDRFFNTEEKLNPAQPMIARDEGLTIGTTENFRNFAAAYEELEVVKKTTVKTN